MFGQLSDKLVGSMRKLSGKDKLTESNLDEVIKEIRRGLLEADVHFSVVKSFIEKVREEAVGQKLLDSISPDQQFTKIVYDQLVELLGGSSCELKLEKGFQSLLLVGLQGVGKTTTAGKLALYARKKLNLKPALVSVDIYRPAAMKQLEILAKQIDVPFFGVVENQSPEEIIKNALAWAQGEAGADFLIVDTAGRQQVDAELMNEVSQVGKLLNPTETLLVVDAMLGQQSVDVAKGFDEKLDLTGLIMTKMDGDARGGAALSIRHQVGLPIKFMGVGEKTQALEIFHPDRLASRILDKGDVVSLVEKAQELMDDKEAEAQAKRMAKSQFTFEDFLKQMKMMKKMGGLKSVMGMLPGMGQMTKQLGAAGGVPDGEMKKMEAMILSMTPHERLNPRVINGSRKVRIAKGSGYRVNDVNKFIKQFEQSQKMMSQMMKMMPGKGDGAGGGMPPFFS